MYSIKLGLGLSLGQMILLVFLVAGLSLQTRTGVLTAADVQADLECLRAPCMHRTLHTPTACISVRCLAELVSAPVVLRSCIVAAELGSLRFFFFQAGKIPLFIMFIPACAFQAGLILIFKSHEV